jgi:hypothetical protein
MLIMSGIVCDYDPNSGVLTMRVSEGHALYYIHDFHIAVFWEPGLRPQEIMKPIVRKNKKSQDIMGA